MRVLRAISLFCLALLVLGAQCRVKCVVVPHESAAAKHPPGCPLHKQAPVQSPASSKDCSHAPQWDYDDVKMVAVLPEDATAVVFDRVASVRTERPGVAVFTRVVSPPLRI
jgi:hypothetical protein